ncbi:MAG: glycosyltransferase family 4 protein [Candidatus Pacebacteria bacterium]|nr:glycosyltransferase family 4 protein [Candidatus Paceibacterota bacterium]
MKKPLRILVTNHHLYQYTGTEVSSLILCKYLRKEGHEVVFYSKYLGNKLVKTMEDYKVKVVDNLNLIRNQKFDIAHVQHNICAYEVRYYFPDLPMVLWVHGYVPFLEQVPAIDLNISYILTINKTVRDHVFKLGVPKHKIIVFRNLVDSEAFYVKKPISKTIKNVLVLSNKLSVEKQTVIESVINQLGLKSVHIGSVYNNMVDNNKLVDYINNADLVFTISLGAIESMFCGRIPILFDENSTQFTDGLVDTGNFDFLKENGFSGRSLKRIMTENDILDDLQKYNYKQGELLRKKALKNYEANQQIKKIVDIYNQAIKNFKKKQLSKKNNEILYHLIRSVEEARFYSIDVLRAQTSTIQGLDINSLESDDQKIMHECFHYVELSNRVNSLNEKIFQLKLDLNKIKNSRYYLLWQKFNKLKKIIK